ncbi:lysozyme inhibitor LprI family protein [Serratia marcescens]|uniref:lysozyme inhibitor LprI family protein n=1 Tax=Serratia marcescens TaxID=615 RepID=UPI0039892DAB
MKHVPIALLLAALAAPFAAPAASFDCAKAAGSDERAICANRTLNDLDVQMATKYQFLRGLFAMGARGAMQDSQQSWLTKRQRCGGDTACLLKSYRTRIAELDDIYRRIDKPL